MASSSIPPGKVRVSSLQYYIRPVRTFDEFRDQVDALVATAADYKSQLVVFPEYFSTQLLTLGDIRRPMPEQIRQLSRERARIGELIAGLARKHKVYIVAGTVPVTDGDSGEGAVYNDSMLFSPGGRHGSQGKLHMTRFERDEWNVSPRTRLNVFETDFGRIAVAICYDVEFPEIARAAGRQGVDVLVVPSCTDDRQGYLRVRYCGHARAIENQMYVIQSSTVGSLPMVPAVSLNYGQSCILTPSDFAFSRDGILAEGIPNQETMVIGDLDLLELREARVSGTVLPLRDSLTTAETVARTEIVLL